MKSFDSDQHWWAKIEGEYWHPLIAHSADVAAVMEKLLEETTLSARLERLLKVELTPQLVHRFCAMGVYHDAGKTSESFQRRNEHKRGHQIPIYSCTAQLASELELAEMRSWVDSLDQWLGVLWGHHGEPIERDANLLAETHWPAANREKLKDFPQWVEDWYPSAFEDGPTVEGTRAQHFFAGLLTLADWIASDEQFFPYKRWHSWETPVDLTDPENAITVARNRAAYAIDKLGLAGATGVRSSYDHVLEEGHEPYEVQEAMQGLPATNSGSLTILESPTGSGKTEGAYMRFLELLAGGYVDSLYFALPTRAAAKQLQRRLTEIRDRTICDDRSKVHLATPGYARVDDVERHQYQRWDELGSRTWASEMSKRYTSSPIAVGTIDQVLLSCLQNRHAHLRGAGLSRSLLVVDEVHASDTYMQELLSSVLDFHLGMGGHAVLMSATLGSSARSIYTGQDVPGSKDAREEDYPMITHVSESGIETRKPGLPDEQKKPIKIEMEEIMTQPDVIASRAEAAAREGAHVLVIRNTVSEAQKTFRMLSEELSFSVQGVFCPHHSRYVAEDRRLMDDRIEAAYGEGSVRSPDQGLVTVATQTVEQSLDIDADYMISDLCPMDVLLQRLGRLFRHARPAQRPEMYSDAKCLVLVPDYRDLSTRIASSGQAWADAGLGSVYGDLRVIEATWQALENHQPEITIPEDNRTLVEEASHPDVLDRISDSDRWTLHAQKIQSEIRAKRQTALDSRLDWDKPYAAELFPSERIPTRPGVEPVSVELPETMATPFGKETEMATLSPFMFDDFEDIDFESESPRDLLQIDAGFKFTFFGERFKYTRIGIHTTE